MSLEDALGPLAMDTVFWMEAVNDPATPVDQLGDICLEVEQKLRAIGVILLLSRGNSDGFFHNLLRGAKTWETYLARCRAQAPQDHNFCAGLFHPLLDALAARDRTLAIRLCALPPTAYRAGHENEDDYCYARVLSGLITGTPAAGDIPALLELCVQQGDAMSRARAEVLRTLTERDATAFGDAFRALLRTREEQIVADEDRGQIAGPVVQAERRLFVEGIALLNLADERGVATEADYPMCPSLARVPMIRPFAG